MPPSRDHALVSWVCSKKSRHFLVKPYIRIDQFDQFMLKEWRDICMNTLWMKPHVPVIAGVAVHEVSEEHRRLARSNCALYFWDNIYTCEGGRFSWSFHYRSFSARKHPLENTQESVNLNQFDGVSMRLWGCLFWWKCLCDHLQRLLQILCLHHLHLQNYLGSFAGLERSQQPQGIHTSSFRRQQGGPFAVIYTCSPY